MRAMLLRSPRTALELTTMREPRPGRGQLLVKVGACGVCRTDLHVVDGELTQPKLPLVPGHEIVGAVAEKGQGIARFEIGDRVGIPWLGWSCGECSFCRAGQENLCDQAKFTGYTLDGFPSMGAWITYALGSECRNLPAFVAIPDPRKFSPNVPPGGWPTPPLPPTIHHRGASYGGTLGVSRWIQGFFKKIFVSGATG